MRLEALSGAATIEDAASWNGSLAVWVVVAALVGTDLAFLWKLSTRTEWGLVWCIPLGVAASSLPLGLHWLGHRRRGARVVVPAGWGWPGLGPWLLAGAAALLAGVGWGRWVGLPLAFGMSWVSLATSGLLVPLWLQFVQNGMIYPAMRMAMVAGLTEVEQRRWRWWLRAPAGLLLLRSLGWWWAVLRYRVNTDAPNAVQALGQAWRQRAMHTVGPWMVLMGLAALGLLLLTPRVVAMLDRFLSFLGDRLGVDRAVTLVVGLLTPLLLFPFEIWRISATLWICLGMILAWTRGRSRNVWVPAALLVLFCLGGWWGWGR